MMIAKLTEETELKVLVLRIRRQQHAAVSLWGGTEKQVIWSDSSVLDFFNVNTNGKNTRVITKFTDEVEGWGSWPSTGDIGCIRGRGRFA